MHSMTIVIPVLNDVAALRQLLDDLDSITGMEAPRIVVDGGSSDGTYALVREYYDDR